MKSDNNINGVGNRGQIAPLTVIIKSYQWNSLNNFYLNKISVFVGKTPPQIKNELNAFSKNRKPNAQLDKYFGKGFVDTILGIINQKTNDGKHGGDEISIDDILDVTPEPESESQPEIIESEQILNIGKSINEPDISLKDILDTIREDKPSIDFKPDLATKNEQPSTNMNNNKKILLEFIDQAIWSIETPMDLKEKIWTYLGIPIFCQHLTTQTQSGDIIPLYYNIYNNNKLVRLNIADALNSSEKYNDVPLINHYYAFRDFFFIQTLDNFEQIDKFISRAASSTIIVDLYDAQDFLNKLEGKSNGFSVLEKDKNMQQLLYYGFFVLFWPMITEDVFQDYIAAKGNLNELAKIYPELLPRTNDHKAANEKEYNLFNLFYTLTESGTSGDTKIISEIERHLYVRLVKNTIINYAYGENKQVILSLRNLFDKLVLNDHIVAIKYATLHANQRIELNKTYKTTKEISLATTLNSLIVRCIFTDISKHDDDGNRLTLSKQHITQNIFDVHFYENGNYFVKCTWGETSQYSFNEGIKIAANFVNKHLIEPINRLKGTVISSTYELLPISPSIVGFSNISAEIYYRKNLSTRDLHLMRYIFRDFYEAKILTADLSNHEDEFDLTYYLWKGNSQQDRDLLHKRYLNIVNTYDYLTKASVNTKWNQIYVRNKAINIMLRQTDIKFSLFGLWDKEFNIAYSYILLAIYMLHSNSVQKNKKYIDALTKDTSATSSSVKKKNIKSLKQIDPVLYDFKQYNSNLIYSKICQQPNQPQILTISEYKALSEKEKARTIKYWNFTTKTETYYYAPNPKYPYINFIIGKHPRNYCIPCAKKTSYERKNNIKHLIYNACMKTHIYENERTNLITNTRYIMNYGKPIDAGRLCKLPENTLEPLFYESFYENAGFEETCDREDRYYLVGTAQEWNGIRHMGMLNIIIAATEMTISNFISTIKKKIMDKPSSFNIFLNGNILHHFYDHREFIDALSKIFITKTLLDEEILNLDWKAIFVDILFYYFNIIVIEFNDKHIYQQYGTNEADVDEKSNIAANVEEVMPGDSVELQVNHKLDILLGDAETSGNLYKYIVIVTKKKKVNPVYMVNPVIYFKSRLISKKVFDRTDIAIEIISKLLLYTKQHNNKKVITESYYSTIDAVNSFIKQSDKYIITTYYVNIHNQCYYIGLKTKSGRNVYLPTILTNWSPVKGIHVEYEPYVYRGKMDIKVLNEFLTTYNKWIMENNEKNTKLGIRVDKWISGPSGKVFGFIFGTLNYYFNDISVAAAMSIKKVPIWHFNYDIVDVNKQLYAGVPIKSDPLVTNIANSFYENHLYQILLLEFTTMLVREKNAKLRMELKKIIMSYGKDSLATIFDNILKLLDKYYSGSAMAHDSNGEDANAIWNDLKMQDYSKIIESINTSITKFMDKNEIYRLMDQSIYNFDKMAINRFKTMTREQIKKELVSMAKKITQSGALPKIADIPNILVSCSMNGSFYCRNKKLIIPEKRLNSLLDILAADIQNPMKEKWIFTPIFIDNIINFLKFEYRPVESITIELD
jgi:hypothetical protein